MRGFVARIPSGTPKTYRNYPKAYHLLMYDEKKEVIFRDIERWVNRKKSKDEFAEDGEPESGSKTAD